MHRLFSRHGCIERFQPLTESDLIDETLNPVFNVLFPTFMEDKNLIYRILLDTYYDVNQQVAGSPLTPRNLASMVLRLGMYWREHQYAFNGNFKLAALLSAYEEVRSYLTPELRTKFKKTLAQKYQPLNTKPCKIALKNCHISVQFLY
ncbi:MAG: hypothetical protein HWD59_09745 [Coxiellaceae bacterium]|nr:MAG: hypothetical protein HWD59_09745 [Coxiellaceae bacterium]